MALSQSPSNRACSAFVIRAAGRGVGDGRGVAVGVMVGVGGKGVAVGLADGTAVSPRIGILPAWAQASAITPGKRANM